MLWNGSFDNSIVGSEIRQVILVDHAIFIIIRDTILKAINSTILIDQIDRYISNSRVRSPFIGEDF